jgi:hypothetical protein
MSSRQADNPKMLSKLQHGHGVHGVETKLKLLLVIVHTKIDPVQYVPLDAALKPHSATHRGSSSSKIQAAK